MRFEVRVLRGEHRRRRGGANPFLPYEPELFVADVAPRHVCLLNRFPAIDDHLLIVTREFVGQEKPLAADDFTALFACLGEGEALGFYNAGPVAGASQPHRHLQLVRLPLGAGPEPLPTAPLLRVPERGVGASSGLPFAHALARRPEDPGAGWQRYLELL